MDAGRFLLGDKEQRLKSVKEQAEGVRLQLAEYAVQIAELRSRQENDASVRERER